MDAAETSNVRKRGSRECEGRVAISISVVVERRTADSLNAGIAPGLSTTRSHLVVARRDDVHG